MAEGTELSKPKVKRPTKIPLALVIAELKSGKTVKQIATTYDVTPETVWGMMRRQGFSIRSLQAYQATKADLLAFRQSQVLEAMDHEKITQASLRDQATTFNILHNAERLERGQSTNNINVASLNMELAEVERQIEELESKMKGSQP